MFNFKCQWDGGEEREDDVKFRIRLSLISCLFLKLTNDFFLRFSIGSCSIKPFIMFSIFLARDDMIPFLKTTTLGCIKNTFCICMYVYEWIL